MEDESPATLLRSLAGPDPGGDEPACRVIAADSPTCPSFWFYDPRLVRMALEAAIHNASRAGATQVLLDARAEEAWMVLGVEDDGAGLPGGRSKPGGGVGLSNVRERLQLQYGADARMTLIANVKGGATATVEIPA